MEQCIWLSIGKWLNKLCYVLMVEFFTACMKVIFETPDALQNKPVYIPNSNVIKCLSYCSLVVPNILLLIDQNRCLIIMLTYIFKYSNCVQEIK